MTLEQRVAHDRLSRICYVDYDREMVLVAERGSAQTGDAEILGVGRLSKLHGTNEAELGLIVSDQWQGKGVGSQLLHLLAQIGRDEKLGRITAEIRADNRVMQHIVRKAGFKVSQAPGAPGCVAELAL
jgi:acetyltransferase